MRTVRFGVLLVACSLSVVGAACARTRSLATDTDTVVDVDPAGLVAPLADGAAPLQAPASTPPARVASGPPTSAGTRPSDSTRLPGDPTTSTSTTAPALRRATFAFSGDVLVHSPLVRHAARTAGGMGFDFAPMFERVRPILSAVDLAICHLETPVAPPGEELSTSPLYGVPAELTVGLAAAGFDRCSTASNHSLDRGIAGVDATVSALEQAGLTQAGMARSADEAIVALVDVAGIAVVHLSYTYGFNGLRLPADEPWRSNPIDPVRIVADAADARSRGAEVVIVSLHWGVESRSAPTDDQRRVADEITRSGAVDLIVGHHAHVVQPVEQVNGRWVVFGLGNFLSNMPTRSYPVATQDGAIVTVAVSELPDGTFTVERPVVTPTWVDRVGGFVIRPVLDDLADPTLAPHVHTALSDSLQRTVVVLGEYVGGGGIESP